MTEVVLWGLVLVTAIFALLRIVKFRREIRTFHRNADKCPPRRRRPTPAPELGRRPVPPAGAVRRPPDSHFLRPNRVYDPGAKDWSEALSAPVDDLSKDELVPDNASPLADLDAPSAGATSKGDTLSEYPGYTEDVSDPAPQTNHHTPLRAFAVTRMAPGGYATVGSSVFFGVLTDGSVALPGDQVYVLREVDMA